MPQRILHVDTKHPDMPLREPKGGIGECAQDHKKWRNLVGFRCPVCAGSQFPQFCEKSQLRALHPTADSMVRSRTQNLTEVPNMKRVLVPILLSAGLLTACNIEFTGLDQNNNNNSTKVDGRRVNLSVSGFADSAAATAPFQAAAASATADYEGIGQFVGEAVVDGFRIRITGVEIMDNSVEPAKGGSVGYWPEGVTLEVSQGFEGHITAASVIPYGTYNSARVMLQTNYDLKAWAFLDRNNDGEADFTMWTTADGIQTANERLASTDEMTGYDYLYVPFLYGGQPIGIAGEFTPLGETITVSETDADTSPLQVDIRLDTFRVAKAWDGSAANRASTFAWDDGTLYPAGQPHFGVGYLPLFALVNQPNAVAETYLFSGDVTFSANALQVSTILFRGDGSAVLGRIRDVGNGHDSLHLSQFIGGFELENDEFTFFGGGDFYANDYSHYSEMVTGFRRLNVGDAPVEITVSGGPACDYCAEEDIVGFAKRIAR
jgi:hypothetical protein